MRGFLFLCGVKSVQYDPKLQHRRYRVYYLLPENFDGDRLRSLLKNAVCNP